MPDIKKNIKFEKQQKEIIDKLFSIIGNTRTFILYDLDNNSILQNNIIELGQEVKKFYSSSTCRGLYNNKSKRPYISIIRFLLKNSGYNYYYTDHTVKTNEARKYIRTKKYIIIKN